MLKTSSQVKEKENIRWSKWNLTGCDKNFDLLVLRANIRKELVVWSPKLLVQNVLNNHIETSIICALCSAKSKGLGLRKTQMTQVRKHAMDVTSRKKAWLQSVEICSAFFCHVRTFIFSWMDKFISYQRLVPVFICFTICGQREMCLPLGQVVSKIYASESNFYLSRTSGQRFCRTLFNIF